MQTLAKIRAVGALKKIIYIKFLEWARIIKLLQKNNYKHRLRLKIIFTTRIKFKFKENIQFFGE